MTKKKHVFFDNVFHDIDTNPSGGAALGTFPYAHLKYFTELKLQIAVLSSFHMFAPDIAGADPGFKKRGGPI